MKEINAKSNGKRQKFNSQCTLNDTRFETAGGTSFEATDKIQKYTIPLKPLLQRRNYRLKCSFIKRNINSIPMHKYEPICFRSKRERRSTDPLYDSTIFVK